jgi:Flp pilus assembly protein TadD
MSLPSRCGRGAVLVVLAGALAGAAVGCAGNGAHGPVSAHELARRLRSEGIDPASVVVPFELSGEMRAWVHRVVPNSVPPDRRLDRLLSALLDSATLQLQYEAGFTGTAREVFESHRANCLGFTNLFVAMAREAELPVYFLDVDDIDKFEKEGDLVVESSHVTAGYGTGNSMRVLDFTIGPVAHYRQVRAISDLTAVALYYSNRGAELLRAGRPEEAVRWLHTAVALDPAFARGWINYGVSLRRTGDLAGAEAAYRKALEQDPQAVSAYQNLATVLRSKGRRAEADGLIALTARLDSRNPFNYLALGDLSLAGGRLDEARRFYDKARRLDAKSAEPCAALAELALTAGEKRTARRWLDKARSLDPANERVQRVARLYERLAKGEAS